MSTPNIPTFIYGTAWKEEMTAELVESAILAGFRAIDTAGQPKHYNEALVGEGLLAAERLGFKRHQLFLQSKFTLPAGQDYRIPYDLNADLKTQLRQSFQQSLTNLKTNYLDSYLLHGPHTSTSVVVEDLVIWEAMEELYHSGKALKIGVSNFTPRQLEMFLDEVEVKPMFVQNRCFASHGWDRETREICQKHHIAYQGFSLLTANSIVLHDPRIESMAVHFGKAPAQIIFRFAIQVGMIPLTGTSKVQHMKEDLEINDFELNQEQLRFIENILF